MKIDFDAERDIGLRFASNAHGGTSFVPEKRGARVLEDYAAHMQAVAEEFTAWETDENRDDMVADLEDYRARYADKLRAYLGAHSRIASQMITGAGGWTASMVRSHEKKNETCDRRCTEWLSWSKKRLEKLRGRYDPRRIANAPIGTGDSDAIERLETKLANHVTLQEQMKAANRIIRKKGIGDEERWALLLETGLREKTLRAAMLPDYMGRVGFPSFVLSNNNATIRRLSDRIASVKAERARRDERPASREVGDVIIEEDARADRLRLHFPDKPSEAVRDALKRRGFRWSPREGAWQRQLTDNARRAAGEVMGVYQLETGGGENV